MPIHLVNIDPRPQPTNARESLELNILEQVEVITAAYEGFRDTTSTAVLQNPDVQAFILAMQEMFTKATLDAFLEIGTNEAAQQLVQNHIRAVLPSLDVAIPIVYADDGYADLVYLRDALRNINLHISEYTSQ